MSSGLVKQKKVSRSVKMEDSNKIYIGNLKFSVREEELKKEMENNGLNPKSVRIVTDKFSGKSRGFGFADFETEEETQKAIDTLDGKEFKGRNLRVSKAKQQRKTNYHHSHYGSFRDRRMR